MQLLLPGWEPHQAIITPLPTGPGGGGGTIPDSADHILISSSATNNLVLDGNRKITNLTLSSKTIDLNGYSLTVYGTATMTSGTVTNGTFYARGNLAAFNGTLMDCPVDADCGYIRFSGSTFNSTVTATDQGVATGTGAGGCTFNDDVTIIHGGNGTYFTLANTTGDVFNADLTVINYSSHEVHLSNTSSTQYKGNITLNSTGTGGITFGNSGGTSTLDSGKTITIGSTGFTNDVLLLKNFTQLGNIAQTLTLTGTAVANFNGSTFNGEIAVSSPGILLKNSTFNGMSSFTKTGTSNAQSDGGNVFNGATTISNTGASGRIRMATVSGDTYNADATFNSTGQDVQIAYSGDNTFAGNITINSNKVVFNTSTGKVTFTGTNNQTLNGIYNYPFKKLAINKSVGTVTANTTLSVDDSLIFIQGNLITTSTNLLTMKHGSTAIGASNSSFVSGPVKKVGNTAFEYPIGKESSYLPLTISAPATTSSEFVAEYIDEDTYVNSTTRDSTLGYIMRDKYWTLQRTSGSSQVYVTLSWNADFRMMDSLITVASWNGAQWKNLGANPFSGSFVQGSVSGTSTSTSYNEFALGYLSLLMRPTLNCSAVTTQVELQSCVTAFGAEVRIINDIHLDNIAPHVLPIQVFSDVTVTGYVTTGSYPNWWEDSCPLLTSDFKALYDPANKANMFLFELDNGATIKNLRLRGSSCNYQDFNFDTYLSGGIISKEISALEITVENCEVSCFSYAGIMTHPQCSLFTVRNNYIHHVKGVGKTVGIGYGIWVMGGSGIMAPNFHETILHNNIFDDCKAAIDGQGHPINWNITKCSFSQFFVSEDINRHNSNLFKMRKPNDDAGEAFDYHYCYENASHTCGTATTGTFWGPISSDPIVECEMEKDPATTSYSSAWLNFSSGDPSGIPIYDVGGINTTINSCIFHKVWGDESASSNINLNFPNRDDSNGRNGDENAQVSITENTFAVTRHAPDAFVNMPDATKNRGGFASLADNYIDACVFQGDLKIITTNNSFDYQSGKAVSGTSPQPCEMKLSLKDNAGTNLLPTGFNFSGTPGQTFIQYVDLGTTPSYTPMKLFIDEGSFGGTDHTYIIRPNQINTNPVTSTSDGVVSEENYFYDGEIRTSNISSGVAIDGYVKPGLYGIDVLSFDATSNPLDFRASSWNHIPVIVKPDSPNSKMLYFNIKDSYYVPNPISATPVQEVYKQVELNGFPIWKESIAEGGNGWEYVEVDLNGPVLSPATGTILSKLNLDGTPNVLTFSIVIKDGETINYSDLKGLMVWVDNVYIPKANSATGDNAIKDGSIERSTQENWNDPLNNENKFWFTTNSTSIPCTSLTALTGANGEEQTNGQILDQESLEVQRNQAGNVLTDSRITQNERRSGRNALILKLPAFKVSTGCQSYPDNNGLPAISIGTHIDFTDILSCDYYSTQFDPFPAFPATNPTAGTNYYLASDITVNNGETLTLNGNLIAIAAGKQIIVEHGGKLEVDATDDRTHLFACDGMWNGIENNNGTIDLYSYSNVNHKTIIEDAEYAIVSNGGEVQILYTVFDHNYQGLKMNDVSDIDSKVHAAEFLCTDGILSKAPYDGKIPYSHIELENITFTLNIGNGFNTRCKIENAYIGILVKSSSVYIKDCFFKNIDNKINMYSSTIPSAGIVVRDNSGSSGSIVKIGGTGGGHQKNSFENVSRGIYVRSITPNLDLDIFGNEFYNLGFVSEDMNTNFKNSAITVQKVYRLSPTITGGHVAIYNNKINDFRIGIYTGNINNLTLGYDPANLNSPLGNEIKFNFNAGFAPSETYRGIWLQNCSGALVANNIVQNFKEISGTTTNFRGIDVEHSADCHINCNNILNIPYSFHFLGHCDGTLLRANEMTHYDEGVHLESATIADQFQVNDLTGDPEPIDNIWNDPTASTGNPTDRVVGTTNASSPFNWLYQTSDGKNNPLDAGMTSPIINALDETAGSVDCNDETNRQSRQTRFGPTVADTLLFADYEEENTWMVRKYAYESMKEDTILLYGDTLTDAAYQTFFWREDSTNTGKFATVRLLSSDSATFGDAAILNELIFDEIALETNLKTANTYYFTKFAIGDSLNDTDSTTILEITYLPYFTGGEGTYLAIGMMGLETTPSIPSLRLQSATIPQTIPDPILNTIQIYPNPTGDNFNVRSLHRQIIKVEIYDAQIKLLKSTKLESTEIEIGINYKPGIYGIKVYLENGETKWFKLVKL
jgi:hypothetical protein